MIYVFDGSFEGLLTAVFEYFERKSDRVALIEESRYQASAFDTALPISNHPEKALRVWQGLQKQLSNVHLQSIYWTFLSEKQEAFQAIFRTIISIFKGSANVLDNYGNPDSMLIAKYTRSVGRERHRMEAFIRFKQLSDGLYFCTIEPDFNVLPLIAKHFTNRYADQHWLIYDQKRKYGIFYNLEDTQQVAFDTTPAQLKQQSQTMPVDNEDLFACLWQDYFKSTNIAARKNTKLHLKHVPKRYWRFLTEKLS